MSSFSDEFLKLASAPIMLTTEEALSVHYAVMAELEGVKLAEDFDEYYRQAFLEKVAWPGSSKLLNIDGETFDFRPQNPLSFKNIGRKLSDMGSAVSLPKGISLEEAREFGNPRASGLHGLASRLMGETMSSAGHHMQHASTAGKLLNPIGKPVGGALEGLTRGIGKEIGNAYSSSPAAGMRGRIGNALMKHAPSVGRAGEILGGAATATGIGQAVSPAAAGLAAVAKGTGVYHPLHHALGSFGTNLAKDVAATGLEGAAGAASRAAPGAIRALSSGIGSRLGAALGGGLSAGAA